MSCTSRSFSLVGICWLMLWVAGCGAALPALAPDLSREQIACHSRLVYPGDSDLPCLPYEILLLDGDGGHRRRIGSGMMPSWSPDGEILVAVDDCLSSLQLIEVSTGHTTMLVDLSEFAEAMSIKHPTWSPDGHTIAFRVDYGRHDDIWTIEDDGTGLRRLTSHSIGSAVGLPSWSPAGELLAYVWQQDSAPERQEIRASDLVAGGFIRVTQEPRDYTRVSWSPDGERIAFGILETGSDARGEIHIANSDGTGEEALGPGFLYGWSPDGERVYFEMLGDDSLWTMDSDGSNRTRLFELDCTDPVWSPVLEGHATKD